MTKRIRDLKREDIEKICNKYWDCRECPLYNGFGIKDCILEIEVEVDD